MSGSHGSAPIAFTWPWLAYWLDFILFPPLAIAIAAYDLRSPAWLAWAAGGFVLWTLVEYWTHRSLLHVYFWHGIHERHHEHPAEYVVFDLWHTPAFFAALLVAAAVTGLLALFCGFVLGYVWFLAMHHWLHHIDLTKRPWLQRYAIWHNRHHKLSDCNYGITVPFWDQLFRTSR